VHDQQGEEGVGHGVQGAAEVGAHVVAVEQAQAHAHPGFGVVRGDAFHVDAGADEGRPQVHQQAQDAAAQLDVAHEALLEFLAHAGAHAFDRPFRAWRMPSDTPTPSGRA
jgi:hypothetical protein